VAKHDLGHELMVMGNGSVPHPEEDRLTATDKNARLNQQLKVNISVKTQLNIVSSLCFRSVMVYSYELSL